jgi:alpha-1,2-mannosyltransferase
MAIVTLLGSIAAYLVVRWLTHPSSIDLAVYRVEGQALRSGMNLYGPLPTPLGSHATYPPFAAMIFVPLTLVPSSLMVALVLALNLGLLAAVALFSCRLAGVDPRRHITAACIVTAVAVWSEPVFTTLRYGQINLLLLALVLWDFTRPASSRTRGIGVGIAAGLKVTPAIFILYLLLTRRFRAAATAAGTMLATVIVSALVVPHATRQYWTTSLFDTARVGRLENAANQSLRGLLVRMDHTRLTAAGEVLLIAAVLAAGLLCAVAAHRHLGDGWGLPACGITGLLTAPIAWTHHWVWCVPIGVVLWQQARGWLVGVCVFWTYAVWAVPHHSGVELTFKPVQIALSAWYVIFGAGFLVLTASRVWTATIRKNRPALPLSERKGGPAEVLMSSSSADRSPG